MSEFSYDDYEDERTAGYVRGSATSENAARSLDPQQRRKQAFKILDLFRRGETYTTDEIEVELGLLHQSVSARITELGQAACIQMTGELRTTGRGGKPANVWKLVPGATEDMFEAFLKKQKEGLQTLKAWTKAFTAAGIAYRKCPSRENGDTVLDIASSAPFEVSDLPSVTAENDALEDEFMEWANHG